MSIRVMSKVWDESTHKGTELLLLIAIADNAADDGFCWPGQVYLAGKIRMNRSSVIRLTRKLEASGELYVCRSRRKGNKYIVRLGMTDGRFLNVLATRLPFEYERYQAIDAISCILQRCRVQHQKLQFATSEVAPMQQEPSLSSIESSHDADAPPAPADTEAKHTVIETQPDGGERAVERTACKTCYRPIVPADEVYPGLSYCKCTSASKDKPPAYHCKHCGDLAKVDTADNLDTQGQYWCLRCGVSYFIDEQPITRDDIAMMGYLHWYAEIDDLGYCSDCLKPTATTDEMPYVGETCTCKQAAALVEAFGPKPEREERPPPPHWREQVKDERALWGFNSPEFQRQLEQYGDAGRKVRLLGADWEQLTQLEPDWEDKQAIKSWSSGLWACLKAAGGDASIVLDATRKAIEDGLTISKPYSVVEVTRALCGERKRGPTKAKVTPMLDQSGLDLPNPLAR